MRADVSCERETQRDLGTLVMDRCGSVESRSGFTRNLYGFVTSKFTKLLGFSAENTLCGFHNLIHLSYTVTSLNANICYVKLDVYVNHFPHN